MKDSISFLILDDDDGFSKAVERYGKYEGWVVDSVDFNNLENISKTIKHKEYDAILVDFKIKNFKKVISLVKDADTIDRVILISGSSKDDLWDTIEKYNIPRFLQKPINLESLGQINKIKEKNDQFESKELMKVVDGFSAAVTIHRKDDLELVWSNSSAKNDPFKLPFPVMDMRLLKLMKNELESCGGKNVVREDWDKKAKAYKQSRLFSSDGYYWLARQVLRQDQNHVRLSASDTLSNFMDKVSSHLKQWGVTRVRLYGADKVNDDYSNKDYGYTLMPLYQSGGGLRVSPHEWIGKEIFHQKGANKAIDDAFYDMLEKHFYMLADVNDHCVGHECGDVEWGNAGKRACIPIRKERDNGKYNILGLLAIDLRTDHLQKEDIAHLIYAGDKNYGFPPLTAEDMALMAGYLQDEVIPLLFELMASLLDGFEIKWHTRISEIIERRLKDKEKALHIFEKIQRELVSEWPKHNNPYGVTNKNMPEEHHNVMNWYFLRKETDKEFKIIAGIGDIAESMKLENEGYLANKQPFSVAMQANERRGHVIQDFSKWLSEHTQEKNGISSERLVLVNKIGSWLGLPFTLQGTQYLMVAHMPSPNYFSRSRVKLFKAAHKRLSALLLWVIAEESRVWFSRSLTHELNMPLSLADNIIKVGKGHKADQLYFVIKMISGMVENVRSINSTHNNIPLKSSDEAICTFEDVFLELKPLIKWGKQNDRKVIRYGWGGFSCIKLAIDKEVLSQIVFNLLHNAIKYSYSSDACNIEINLLKSGDFIDVKITNPTKFQLNDEDRERIFLPYFRTKDAITESGGGLGLAVVRRLCDQAGMQCIALPTEKRSNRLYQSFSLFVPIFYEDKLQ